MKQTSRALMLICMMLAFSCSKPADSDATSDADTVATNLNEAVSDPVEEPTESQFSVNIGYERLYDDSLLALYTFTPFDQVEEAASKAFVFEDSIRNSEGNGNFDPKDSIAAIPLINKAYEVLINYQRAMEQGMKLEPLKSFKRPKGLTEDDESYDQLTRTESTLLTNRNFGFMGGFPFVTQDENIYKGPSGGPETRYIIQIPDNARYLFNYMYRFNSSPVEFTYGPPVHTYSTPYEEIKGIGSLIHTLKRRIPVWLITESGPVEASLVSVEMKLAWEYGCVSNNPAYVFATSVNLSTYDILGVFVSPENFSMANLKISRPQSHVWLADLDGDGEAEFACVRSTFSGASSDELKEMIWFAMVNDNWMVIDYASEPDCT